MEKSYLRYRSGWSCGVVTSPRCNIAFDPVRGEVVCGSVRDVVCWQAEVGNVESVLRGEVEDSGYETSALEGARGEVVAVAVPSSSREDGLRLALAAGYASGLVRVWRGRDELDRFDLDGHRGAVAALRWCPAACSLCSGGPNGDVVVWDVVAGSGSCRLRGHASVAADCCFLAGWDRPGQRRILVTVAHDALVKIWDVDAEHCMQTVVCEGRARAVDRGGLEAAAAGDFGEVRWWVWEEEAIVERGATKRARPGEPCAQLRFCPGQERIAALTPTALEVYRRSDKKKRKRSSEWVAIAVVFPEDKPRSFAWESPDTVVFGTRHNTIERHAHRAEREDDQTLLGKVEVTGHRSAVRSVSLSADGQALAAASTAGIKLWRTGDGRLSRSVRAKKALAVKFLPGDLEVVVGTKDGSLLLVDLTSGDVREARAEGDEIACAGPLWALDAKSTKNLVHCMSAGGDPVLKLWRKKRTTLTHVKSVRLGEDALCARYVCSSSYAAVATMDACVRIFYADSLKFKATLYGHALAVLCLDGSRDGQLLATGAGDKSLKFWGLDFGDLRRSTLAHDDALTALAFLGATHYLLTASKDGDCKMWDADAHEPFVQVLKRGHVGEVWALAVSDTADVLYTAGADRSVRAWLRTDEPVFPSEEIDVALEAARDRTDDDRRAEHDRLTVARPSTQAAKAADRIADALEIALAQKSSTGDPDPLLLGMPPHLFVVHCLHRVASPDLEPAIVVLPLPLLATLLGFLLKALQANNPNDLELIARCAHVAVKLHHRAVIAHRPLAAILRPLRTALRAALAHERRIYGANLAALRIAGLQASPP